MKFFLIGLITFYVFQPLVVCQTKEDKGPSANYKKNVVYGTAGLFPGVTTNINYERRITHLSRDTAYLVKYTAGSLNLRLGYGKYEDISGIAKMCLLSSNFVFGKGSAHFEADIGAAFLFNIVRQNTDKETGINPIINLGLRLQNNNMPIVLRAGIGWPDCIYTSLGFAF